METVESTRPHAQKKTLIAVERLRADVAEARRLWDEAKPKLDPRRLIFPDETWTKTNMTRLRGRAPRGQRLVGHAPWGGMGKQQPSWPAYGTTRSWHPWCWIARLTGPPSAPMFNNSWHQCSVQATLSLPTICPATKWRASAKPSPRREQSFSCCRPIRQTRTLSSKSSPS